MKFFDWSNTSTKNWIDIAKKSSDEADTLPTSVKANARTINARLISRCIGRVYMRTFDWTIWSSSLAFMVKG